MINPNYLEATSYGLKFSVKFFQDTLQHYFSDATVEVISATYIPSAIDKVAWSPKNSGDGKHPIGVHRYELTVKKNGYVEKKYIITKSKISDCDYLKVISGAFEKCGIHTERPIIDYLSQLEFANLNVKEVAIYNMQLANKAFQDFMPTCYGTYLTEAGDVCVLILECLEEDGLSLNPFDTSKWDQEAIEAVIKAYAAMHAVWYNKEEQIAKIKGFENVLNTEKMISFMPYWRALAKAALTADLPFLAEPDYDFHEHIIKTIPHWRSQIDLMHKTLIQNDCSLKNIAVYNKEGHKKAYIYDWEIATIHIPQRDIIEFLSYALPEKFESEILKRYLEMHRVQLSQVIQENIDSSQWLLGGLYAAQDFLLQRVLPQLPFEKLEPRNVKKIYQNTRRIIDLLNHTKSQI